MNEIRFLSRPILEEIRNGCCNRGEHPHEIYNSLPSPMKIEVVSLDQVERLCGLFQILSSDEIDEYITRYHRRHNRWDREAAKDFQQSRIDRSRLNDRNLRKKDNFLGPREAEIVDLINIMDDNRRELSTYVSAPFIRQSHGSGIFRTQPTQNIANIIDPDSVSSNPCTVRSVRPAPLFGLTKKLLRYVKSKLPGAFVIEKGSGFRRKRRRRRRKTSTEDANSDLLLDTTDTRCWPHLPWEVDSSAATPEHYEQKDYSIDETKCRAATAEGLASEAAGNYCVQQPAVKFYRPVWRAGKMTWEENNRDAPPVYLPTTSLTLTSTTSDDNVINDTPPQSPPTDDTPSSSASFAKAMAVAARPVAGAPLLFTSQGKGSEAIVMGEMEEERDPLRQAPRCLRRLVREGLGEGIRRRDEGSISVASECRNVYRNSEIVHFVSSPSLEASHSASGDTSKGGQRRKRGDRIRDKGEANSSAVSVAVENALGRHFEGTCCAILDMVFDFFVPLADALTVSEITDKNEHAGDGGVLSSSSSAAGRARLSLNSGESSCETIGSVRCSLTSATATMPITARSETGTAIMGDDKGKASFCWEHILLALQSHADRLAYLNEVELSVRPDLPTLELTPEVVYRTQQRLLGLYSAAECGMPVHRKKPLGLAL